MAEPAAAPRFTVVIPVHNKGPLLAEALACVAAQTCRDFEVIVVDDASSDGGLGAVERFPDLPLRLLRRATPGPGGYAARNLGIQAARGAWIAFLDADDLWFPEHLATAAAWLDRHPQASVVCTGFQEVLGASVRTIAVPEGRCFEAREFLALYARKDWFHTNSMLIRRRVLLEGGGFPEQGVRRGGDHAVWFRSVLAGDPVILVDAVTSCYRRDHSEVVSDPVTMVGPHPVARVAAAALAGVIPLRADWGRRERRLIRQFANRKGLHWMLQRKRMGLPPSPGQTLPYPRALSPRDLGRWLVVLALPRPLLTALFALKARLEARSA
jgi:succinoglycan biosynthesis protein ExoO